MDNSNDSIRELFGPPPPRRPIPSNSFNALVKIFSLFPDQNPFSEYASYAKLPGYLKRCHDNLNNTKQQRSVDFCNDGVGPRGDLEASKELVGSTTVEASKLSINDEVNNRGVAEDLCKDVNCSGLKLMIDELDGLNQHKSMNKIPSDEEGTVTGMAEANELIMYELGSTNKNKKTDKMLLDEVGVGFRMAKVDKIYDELSDIERILMNEADDFGVSQLPDKDVNIGFLNDFSLILDTDVCNNDFMTIESRKSGEPSVAVNMKGNVEGEKNQKNVDVNRSTSGDDEANSHTHLSAVRKRSDCQELVNQCVNASPGEAQRKDRKLCEEKISQKLSAIGGLTFVAQKSDNERTVLSGDRKANHSGIVTKDKTKDAMDKSEKDVNSGKSKLSSIGGGTSYNMRYGGADSVVRAKMVEQNVCGNTEKFSSRKVENDTKCRERVQFSRQELLNLRKMPSIHEEILKRIREIDAEVHGKDQNSASGKIIGSSIMNKKQGSSLEGKKEKKKRKRRMARAEMNKKLGVKRLKLKPDLKPKVIATCRHYLKGRCQEGENCKFSHDELPLTKFKPCCHFARQACMKGDDCPFDHQLSNYPCNAYVDTGFCSRGDSCLFSHKNSAKAGSETVADVSKGGTASLDKLNKSNFKHQHKADVSFSSVIATPNCPEEDLAKQASQPAKAPKGLSFLPLGKSSLKDSSNHEETDLFQKFGGAPETSGQPNIATTSTVNLVGTLMDTPPSDAPEEKGFISSLKASVGSSGHKKPANPSFHWVNPSFVPKMTSLQDSAKHEKMHSSNRSDDTVGTSNQLNKVMPSRVADPSPMIPKPINGLSGEPLYDHGGGRSQAVLPCTGNPDPPIREKEGANGPEKAIQRKVCDSSNSSGQCSTKGGVKDASSTSQRALLSTLAFAAKFESGIKMTSAATSKVAMDEGTSTISNGCRQNEPSKASAMLDFLYSGGKKENSKAGI